MAHIPAPLPLLPLLLLSAVLTQSAPLQRYELPASYGEAVCLDGSPYSVYISNATSAAHADDWVFFFQGGGWCSSENDCYFRAQTGLGSSVNWTDEISIGGLLDQNCDRNPAFCAFNQVSFPYCDGNSWASNLVDPLVVNNTKLYMRGRAQLDATIDFLRTRFNLDSARNVMVSGCSAGGLAAYLHADYIHSVLKTHTAVQKYKVIPLSGFFLNHTAMDGAAAFGSLMKNSYLMSNASVNTACVAANPGAEWRCFMAAEVYQHMEAPVFVLNSAMDQWQSYCVLGGCLAKGFPHETGTKYSAYCSCFPEYNDCLNIPAVNCTAAQAPILNEYATFFMDNVTSSPNYKKPQNGAFIHSCHTHCEGYMSFYYTMAVDGITMSDAVTAWWNEPQSGGTSLQHTHTPCVYKVWEGVPDRRCNPTCPLDSMYMKDNIWG